MRPAKKMDLLRRCIVAVEVAAVTNKRTGRKENDLRVLHLDDGTRIVLIVTEGENEYHITAHVAEEGTKR